MYSFDFKSLMVSNKRWFPVMGEIHFSRYPRAYWKESLCKMKAGGVDIVSSYVIWIHHEEIENIYNFTEDRNLHDFVLACQQCNIKMILRIGPWCHGEVRNGGFPDWLLKKGFKCRTNDKAYLEAVRKWYTKIYEQVSEFLCTQEDQSKTIIGIQIENEYGHCGGLTGEDGELHMKKLLQMAKDIGFNVPIYTATGWGGAVTAGMLPVMGGYVDAPWDPRVEEIEPSGNYVFTYERNDHNIGSDYGLGHGITFNPNDFPYLTAELGGGLQVTKHRRTVALADDIAASSLVKLGSGVTLLGYYMYHGGTNPDGKITSLQETKATGYPNDLPEKSYDFRAPIRQYGQISQTYRELKLLTLFVHDFGEELCELPACIPEDNPLKPEDTQHLRYSFRTDGSKGYVFVNNHVRHQKRNSFKNIKISLENKEIFKNLNVEENEFFFLPFDMEYGKTKIEKALVTPFCKVKNENNNIFVFYARKNEKKTSGLIDFQSKLSSDDKFLVLSREDALNLWKTSDEELFITKNALIEDETGKKNLIGRDEACFEVFPPLKKCPEGFIEEGKINKNISSDTDAVEFTRYRHNSVKPLKGSMENSQMYGNSVFLNLIELETILNEHEEFDDCFVKITYLGNTARLYGRQNGKEKLVDDNFFMGEEYPWEISLKHLLSRDIDLSALRLTIMPLRKDEHIYIEKWPEFNGDECCSVCSCSYEFEWKLIL